MPKDDDYVSRTGQKEANVPVTSDDQIPENNPSREQADSDEQLGKSWLSRSSFYQKALLTRHDLCREGRQ